MSDLPPPVSDAYKDRKTGLIVFGVFEILIGVMCLFSGLGMLLAQFIAAHRPEMAAQMGGVSLMPTLLLMAGIAAMFVWLGIGSIQARRWARALSLCLGWMGLIMGVLGCGLLFFTLPAMDVSMQQAARQSGQEMPAAALVIAKVFAAVFTVILYVVIPGALVLFYRSRHVKLTCEARDPVPRWTDRCPLPVLALVLVQVFGAISMLAMLPSYGRAFPLFGTILHGAPAAAVYLLFALVSLYVARGCYRLERRALWIYMALLVVGSINSIVSFSGGRLMVYYEAIGMPEQQLRQLRAMPFLQSSSLLWFGIGGALAIFAYLWWVKRFFEPAASVNGT